MKGVILLADNRDEDRVAWGRILSQAGYDVRPAQNPEQARHILRNVRIDAAVIDLRLVDDEDGHDISGLLIAKEIAYRHIPKIILTAFDPGYRSLREVMGPMVDELPPAVAFVKKDEGPQTLVEVLNRTLENWPRLRMSAARVSEQIKEDHNEARRQAHFNYRVTFVLSILGSFFIFAGIGLAWYNQITIAVVGTAGGIIVEVISLLFFTRVNLANDRMDAYHRELLQTYWFEFLLASAEQLPPEKREVCIEHAINRAVDSWLTSASEGHKRNV